MQRDDYPFFTLNSASTPVADLFLIDLHVHVEFSQ